MTVAEDTAVVERGKKLKLSDLQDQCKARESRFFDDIVSLKSLSMSQDDPGMLLINRGKTNPTQKIPFQDHVYQQAPNVVYGLPGGYLKKLVNGDHADPELAARNFNHWVKANKDREVLLRFQNGTGRRNDDSVEPTLRALLSGSWNPIPYDNVVEMLVAQHGGDHPIHIEKFDSTGLVFNLITKKLERENAKVGDDVEWGLRFQDSDVGLTTHLRLTPYTLTLWCTNSCTTMGRGANVNISHSGKAAADVGEVMTQVASGMGMIHAYSKQVVQQIDAAEKILLEEDKMPELRARVTKRFDITKLMNKYALEGWELEAKNRPDPTALRFANAYTRAANADELNDDARFRLQATGGALLELAVTPSWRWN